MYLTSWTDPQSIFTRFTPYVNLHSVSVFFNHYSLYKQHRESLARSTKLSWQKLSKPPIFIQRNWIPSWDYQINTLITTGEFSCLDHSPFFTLAQSSMMRYDKLYNSLFFWFLFCGVFNVFLNICSFFSWWGLFSIKSNVLVTTVTLRYWRFIHRKISSGLRSDEFRAMERQRSGLSFFFFFTDTNQE